MAKDFQTADKSKFKGYIRVNVTLGNFKGLAYMEVAQGGAPMGLLDDDGNTIDPKDILEYEVVGTGKLEDHPVAKIAQAKGAIPVDGKVTVNLEEQLKIVG